MFRLTLALALARRDYLAMTYGESDGHCAETATLERLTVLRCVRAKRASVGLFSRGRCAGGWSGLGGVLEVSWSFEASAAGDGG